MLRFADIEIIELNFFDVFKSEFEDALPEIDENSYYKLIETYDVNYKGYDSLVGVYEKISVWCFKTISRWVVPAVKTPISSSL